MRVSDAADTDRRAGSLGGAVIVPPFAVSSIARIALIQDSGGGQVGLWQPV